MQISVPSCVTLLKPRAALHTLSMASTTRQILGLDSNQHLDSEGQSCSVTISLQPYIIKLSISLSVIVTFDCYWLKAREPKEPPDQVPLCGPGHLCHCLLTTGLAHERTHANPDGGAYGGLHSGVAFPAD